MRDWAADLEIDSDTGEIPTPAVTENAFDTLEVQQACKADLDFLAALCMPTVFKYLFPRVFKGIWEWLLSYVSLPRDFSQLAIGLPRGFGKTMVIKLFIIYCILFTKKTFILVICGTQGKANNIIFDVMAMLDEPNVKKVFGWWRTGEVVDRQDMKQFGFRGRNILLIGAGAQSDIRGITRNNERPDVIIFDDIQTREDADSEVISSQLETWMFGTAMKAKSPEGCLFIFIANMYPTKYSLLRKLKQSPTWVKFIAGGILADGTSLWEDLQPIKQLLKEFENDLSVGKPEVFYSEVLNDENATVNHLIDLSKLPPYPYLDSDISEGNFIVIDPSTDKVNADAVTIAYFQIYDLKPVLQEIDEGRYSPGETISRALTMAIRRKCQLIGVEAQAYQYSLLYWFEVTCRQHGIEGIRAEPVYSGSTAKNSRILTMFKALLAGEIFIHPNCSAQTNAQISGFNPGRRDNTDGLLDCITYGPKMIELYGPIIFASATLEDQEYNSIPVRSEYEIACF